MPELIHDDGSEPIASHPALARYERPLVADLTAFDTDGIAGETFSVVFEGRDVFAEGHDLADVYSDVMIQAARVVGEAGMHPEDRLLPGGLVFPLEETVHWRLEGLWDRGDEGNWGGVAIASSSVVAELDGYLQMTSDDAFADHGLTSTKDEIEKVVRCIRVNTIFPPVPVVMPEDQMVAALKAVEFALSDLPADIRGVVAAPLAAISGKPVGERRVEGAADGDVILSFESTMPGFEGVDLVTYRTAKEFEDEVGDPSSNEERLSDFVLDCAKGVAGRYHDLEKIGGDSAYLDRIDAFVDKMRLTGFGLAGPLRDHRVDAVWFDDEDEGPWSDDVVAVDHEDARFQAALAMASSEPGIGEGPSGFEAFAEAVSSHCIDILPLPASTAKMEEALRALAGAKRGVLPEVVRRVAGEYEAAQACFDRVVSGSKAPETEPAPAGPAFSR